VNFYFSLLHYLSLTIQGSKLAVLREQWQQEIESSSISARSRLKEVENSSSLRTRFFWQKEVSAALPPQIKVHHLTKSNCATVFF
jgi:hypothetical protein